MKSWTKAGLQRIADALRRRGCVAIGSAKAHGAFATRLRKTGFMFELWAVKARPGKGNRHKIFLARKGLDSAVQTAAFNGMASVRRALGEMLILGAGCSLILLGGCATKSRGEWQAQRPANTPYENMLVVAVSWTENLRQDIEELVVDDLTSDQTRVTSSYRLETAEQQHYQSKEQVLELVQKTGADSLLVVWMVNEDAKLALTQAKGYIDYGPQDTVYEHPHMTEIWLSDYTVKETSQLLTDDLDVQMEAVVYDVQQMNQPIYTIELETKYAETGSDTDWIVASRMAEAISKKLRGARLVHN